jgi:Cu2+-exporting ATPase
MAYDPAELPDLESRLNAELRHAEPEAILARATELFPEGLALVSSFGAESAVLLHMVAQVRPDLPILFLDTGMLFGQTLDYRKQLAARLGIQAVHAEATPEAKLALLTALQASSGPVVMVGDGVNDAPVLARADASLAMGQGALVARAQADAVVTSSRLSDFVKARRRALRAMALVRQNFMLSAVYNATCIPLALIGWLPPWAAGLGMATSSLVVILNAQRAAR